MAGNTGYVDSWLLKRIGYIAQWLERLAADQQVPGSNPGAPSPYLRSLFDATVVRLRYSTVHGQRDRVVRVMD